MKWIRNFVTRATFVSGTSKANQPNNITLCFLFYQRNVEFPYWKAKNSVSVGGLDTNFQKTTTDPIFKDLFLKGGNHKYYF
jgi:hypothetical protein